MTLIAVRPPQALIIKLFNAALVTSGHVRLQEDFAEFNKRTIPFGYIVHPDVATEEVANWVESNHRNLNSTFYKSFQSILSKNRLELLFDQILHYLTTYGTNFQGQPYIPDETLEVPPFTQYKVILPITEEELTERIKKMFASGIALSQETVEELVTIMFSLGNGPAVKLEDVKNREARMYFCAASGVAPEDPTELVRFLVFLLTGSTLLIKDRKTIKQIKESDVVVTLNKLPQEALTSLASVFYRFKPLFLAMKNKETASAINAIRRLAVRNHKPMKPDVIGTILSNPKAVAWNDFVKAIEKATNFRKVTLIEAVNKRIADIGSEMFVIRNGKFWLQPSRPTKNWAWLRDIQHVVYNSLVKSLSAKKGLRVALPDGINITVPRSAKSFVGNYPLGSWIDFTGQDDIFGINWRGEDGADDLDLSLLDVTGAKFGWNADYRNGSGSIIYSGDMTSANPEATELFYAGKGFNPAIVKVNRFRGAENSKFRFFVAKERAVNLGRNYMVNPSNVVVSVDSIMDEKEKTLGIVTPNKFVFMILKAGNKRVSKRTDVNPTSHVLKTLDCFLSLRDLLTDAGMIITNENPDVDLRNPAKDTLINLIA